MSKARPTAFQKVFWGDFFAKTAHLTWTDRAAYMIMIGRYWSAGKPLPDDNAVLARLLGATEEEWLRVRPALEEFFVIASGEWRHERIEHDLVEAHEAHARAVEWGKKSKGNRLGKSENQAPDVDKKHRGPIAAPVVGSPYQPEAEAEPIKKEKTSAPPSLENEFEDFWAAYSRHDKRREAEKAFSAALKKVGGDPTILTLAAKRYSRQFTHGGKDKQFQAMAASWLNGERWTDPVSVAVSTPEHTLPRQTTIAEDIAAAGALIEENPVSFIPSWFKGS